MLFLLMQKEKYTVIHKDWFVKKLESFQKGWFFEKNTKVEQCIYFFCHFVFTMFRDTLLCEKLIYEILSAVSI